MWTPSRDPSRGQGERPNKQSASRSESEETDLGSAGDAMMDFLSDHSIKSDGTTDAVEERVEKPQIFILENESTHCHTADSRWDKLPDSQSI